MNALEKTFYQQPSSTVYTRTDEKANRD